MKVYIVMDIGFDCRDGDILGVFSEKEKAENFAIDTAVKMFGEYGTPNEARQVYYDGKNNIQEICDERDYLVDIVIREEEVQ